MMAPSMIPTVDPSLPFDFEWEATTAAVNEACAGGDVECSWAKMCPYCQALKKAIEVRLKRAFDAGRLSMSKMEDGNE